MESKSLSPKKRGLFALLKANPHVFLLIYWLVYFILFMIEEQLITDNYTPIYIPLDDKFPFCKWFAIPYAIWYPYIIVPLLWLMVKNIPEFKRLMWFIMITYSITLVIYAVFPNGQDLRPQTVEGNGLLEKAIRFLYSYDTNTNVCPSIHVIGTLASTFALMQTKLIKKWWSAFIIAVFTISICFSIVFMKQHSIVDLFAGVTLSAVIYPVVYNKKMKAIAEGKSIFPFPSKKKEEKKEEIYI